MKEYVYSPHYDFFIDKAHREHGYNMRTFHFHKKYEIYLQCEGTRRYYINDSAYLINAGTIVIINHDSIHKTVSVDDTPHTRYVLNFSAELLSALGETMPGVNLFHCFETGIPLLQLNAKRLRLAETLMNELWEHRDDESELAAALRKMQLAALLLYLGQYADEEQHRESESGRIVNPTIVRIQEYISTNYRQDLSLTGIASQFYISPYYLSRLFKKTTNLSIVEYINSVRIMAAKNLLENGNSSIGRIAETTGFATTAHFSRVFRASTGLSPQKYRKYYMTSINN